MKKYKCLRCGHETDVKIVMKKHLNRKYVCKPKLSDMNVDEVYEKIIGGDMKQLYVTQVQNKIETLSTNKCSFCDKEFANKFSKMRHMQKSCKKNPLKNMDDLNFEKIEKKDGGGVIINIQNNIQQNINIGKIILNNDNIVTIQRDNIENFGNSAKFSMISDMIYKKTVQDGTIVPDVNKLVDELHFGKNNKYHNIRMVRPFDNAKHHKIENVDIIMYDFDINNIQLQEINIDDECAENFEEMFTQILTDDGWKNVNVKDVVHLLFAFIILKIEEFLDEKIKTVTDKKTRNIYEEKINNFNTIQLQLRKIIKCYNKYGEIIPKKLISVKNVQKISEQTGTDIKEVIYSQLEQIKAMVDEFNKVIANMIETIKTKSTILHGDLGEKFIILNNKINVNECTFDSLVDGLYYKKIIEDGKVDCNFESNKQKPQLKSDIYDLEMNDFDNGNTEYIDLIENNDSETDYCNDDDNKI